MTPDQIVQILLALNIAQLLRGVQQEWAKRKTAEYTRKYTDVDAARQRDRDHEERLLKRIDELEKAQEERDAARDQEIRVLRQEIADCHKNHMETRVTAAVLQNENAAMKLRMDELEQRRSNSGPPQGQPERRQK